MGAEKFVAGISGCLAGTIIDVHEAAGFSLGDVDRVATLVEKLEEALRGEDVDILVSNDENSSGALKKIIRRTSSIIRSNVTRNNPRLVNRECKTFPVPIRKNSYH
jgi:hypothetical protein